MCDTGHDDPGLQPTDLLRRHTEQQEIIVIPAETAVAVHRTRIARKSGAPQTSSLAHLGSALFQNQCAVRCRHMSPEETTLHMPAKKTSEDDTVQKTPLDNTSDEVPKLQVEESTSFWTDLRSPSTQRASRGQRALGGPPSACTWVWFHLETNVPKCRRANSGGVDLEPSEKYVSEGDGVKGAPLIKHPTRCQTGRPEERPLGREPCHEKSEGSSAAVK